MKKESFSLNFPRRDRLLQSCSLQLTSFQNVIMLKDQTSKYTLQWNRQIANCKLSVFINECTRCRVNLDGTLITYFASGIFSSLMNTKKIFYSYSKSVNLSFVLLMFTNTYNNIKLCFQSIQSINFSVNFLI